jgi:hypothetical protein
MVYGGLLYIGDNRQLMIPFVFLDFYLQRHRAQFPFLTEMTRVKRMLQPGTLEDDRVCSTENISKHQTTNAEDENKQQQLPSDLLNSLI